VNNKNKAERQRKLKTYICIYLFSGVLALLGFCLLLYLSVGGVSNYIPEHLSFDEEVKIHIDHIVKKECLLSLSGWALVPEESIETYRIHILLQNTNNSQYLKIPTIMSKRTDVTQYFHDPYFEENFNYDMSGWQASVKTGRLSLPLEQYEVVLLYQNNLRYIIVHTGRYLDEE